MTKSTAARYGAAVASGLLLAAARPPVDFGLLALVALVPLFVAWRGAGARRRAALAFTAGVVYYALLASWTWYFGAIAIVPLVAILAGSWAAIGALTGWLARKGLDTPWLTAAVWVVFEGIIARAPLDGFSWGEVGYAFAGNALARDVASIGGLVLVSYLAVAINAFLADLAVRPSLRDTTRALAGLLAVVVLAALAPVIQTDLDPTGTLRVAILQGNDKNRSLTPEERADRFLPNSHFDLVSQIEEPVDLIIFPESSMDEDPRTDAELGRRLSQIAREYDAWVLANAIADDPDDPVRHAINLNVLYGPDGEVQGTYAKRHLVPFGERVPGGDFTRGILPMVDEEIPRDFVAGDEAAIFDIAGLDVATVICFESAFGYEVRPLAADGAEIIVVSTNNRSYRRSANSAQHLAIGQMRAAETGRPLVQAAISGISAYVDAEGNVTAQTDLFERTVLQHTVVAFTGETVYVRFGEWALWGSLVAVFVCVVIAIVRTRRRRSVDSADAEPVDRLISLAIGDQPVTESHQS